MRKRLNQYMGRFKRLYRLNEALHQGRQERLRARGLPSESWEGFAERVFKEAAPTFILSTGRCGTKLLTEAFERQPGVLCAHSPTPELLYESRLAYEQGEGGAGERRAAIRGARFEIIAEAYLRERVYIETNNRVTFFAHELAELFPNSRFVHVVRHPGAFVRSGVRRGYYRGQYGDIGRIRPVAEPLATLWAELGEIARVAWLWNETNRFVEEFKSGGVGERCAFVKAEDLFADPEAILQVAEHAQVPELPTLSSLVELQREPVNADLSPTDLPRYEDWSDEDKASLARYAPLASEYGYTL